MENIGCLGNQEALQEYSNVPEIVSSEEQEVRENLCSRLRHASTLKNEDVDIVSRLALQLAQFNTLNAKRVYYTLQYLLERKPMASERKIIIKLIDKIVVAEHREMNVPQRLRKAPKYIPVINAHLFNISYASDESYEGEVREFLHQCIASWIRMGVSHRDSLVALQKVEKGYKYHQPRPKLEIADNSPSSLDLVFQGLAGLGLKGNLEMQDLVQKGILEGQRDGWITRNEDGSLEVQCR